MFTLTLIHIRGQDTLSSYNFSVSKLSWDKVETGGRLNKKDGLTRYGDSHVKDKTS